MPLPPARNHSTELVEEAPTPAASTQTKGSGSGCEDGWVSADITNLARAWATNPYNENILGVRAADEKDPYAWKRFSSRNAASGVPVISVTYDRLPSTPSAVKLDPSATNTFNKRTYATSSTPTFSAKVTDPDGGTVKAQFEVTADPGPGDAGSYSWTGTSTGVASGATAKVTLPADKKLGSFAYRVRVRAHDSSGHGPWSEHVTFRVNTLKPVRPTISCDGFAQDEWTDKSGDLSCTFTTTSSDGRGFLYGLDDPNTQKQVNDPAGTGGKPGTVKLKAAKGWHTLHARTVDSAGLLSGTSTFQFGVGPKPAALLVPDRPTTLQEGAIDTPAPLLSGVVTSPDQARVSGAFALYDASGEELPGVVLPQPSEESGSRVATAVPEGTLVPGTTYQWAMRACGEAACSPWTPRRTFTAKDAKADPVPHTRTVEITALSDATAPVGAEDCPGKDCAAVRDETLHVGTPGGASWRSWLKADPAAIPAGARITDARLKLHRADCSADDDCVEPAPTLKDLAEAWSPEQSGQALAAAASDEAFDTEEGLPLPLQDLNVGPLVADWLETGENHGLSLQLGDEKDAAPGMAYHSSRAADPAKRPRLAVSYISSAAPGAPQDVKAVPADGGLLATWNAPQDPGSATDALKYTVVVHKGATEVARQTVDDTRAVFSGLANGAAHAVTVSATSEFGTSKTTDSVPAKPVKVASQDRYAQAVRDYFEARAALLKGTHTTAEKAAAASPHAAMFRDLLAGQAPDLILTREANARHGRHFSQVEATLDELLTGPGPDDTVVVRGRVAERTVLTDKDGDQEPEEGEVPGRFVFADGVLRMEADDAAVEVTMPTDEAAAQAATVAPPAEDSLAGIVSPEDEGLPIELDADGMLVDDPAAWPRRSSPLRGSRRPPRRCPSSGRPADVWHGPARACRRSAATACTQRRPRLARDYSPTLSKASNKSAATLTAIVAGSLPVMSVRPIGVLMRSIVVSSWPPSVARRLRKRAHLAAEPIRPTEPRCVVRRAASQRAASSAWSWVMIRMCVPAGRSSRISSGSSGVWWTCTCATASDSASSRASVSVSARLSIRCRSRSWRARIRASSRPTWPTPKIATALTTGSGSSRMETVPPQHCTPCWLVTLSFRAKSISSGSALAATSSSRARSIATASTLPPPIEPHVSRCPTTSLAPASRGA